MQPVDDATLIEWDTEYVPTVLAVDTKRLQKIWVKRGDTVLGGVYVSTTGYAETVLRLSDDD
ncbi:MAG TPA: hypothetical protein VGP46_02295 [Acidimicrobiales bacterium]|jgi:hypothetical protein|nr:hypothetical protein [Acidimicrobiales bacterium]